MFEWVYEKPCCDDCKHGLVAKKKPKRTGGSAAVKNGRAIEDMIEYTLKSMSAHGVTYHRPRSKTKPFCKSIYGRGLNPDFVVNGLQRFPDGLVIESKYQSVSGSGDEKPAYALKNIIECIPIPTLLIFTFEAGPDATKGVQDRFDAVTSWLRKELDKHRSEGGNKFVDVLTIGQFPRWILTETDRDH